MPWLTLLSKYWKQLALILTCAFLVLGFSHWRYSAGYSKAHNEWVTAEAKLAVELQNEKDTHAAALAASQSALDSATAAKDQALAKASQLPKTLIKVIHDETNPSCDVSTAGPDFERVWNSQSEAYSGSH